MRRVLIVCEDCGTPYPGVADDEETLQVQGRPDCPDCGGANLRELPSDEIRSKCTDDKPA